MLTSYVYVPAAEDQRGQEHQREGDEGYGAEVRPVDAVFYG